jgi:hypothetical protein
VIAEILNAELLKLHRKAEVFALADFLVLGLPLEREIGLLKLRNNSREGTGSP